MFKIPIKEIIKNDYNLTITKDYAIKNQYLIKQPNSLFFDQIERIRGKFSEHISEIILIEARKNPKTEKELEFILNNGFMLNNIQYIRFGKSASQGKDGITAFVDEKIYEELYMITQLDIPIDKCVISKYEAQRCLVFSSCTIIQDYKPYIIIIDEYEKILENQFIKYVVEKEKEFTDKITGEIKKYNAREIEDGYRDIKLSPFDGCGCHEKECAEICSKQLGLDYRAVGFQIREPFIKGYSVYVPFKQIFKEWGYTEITDVYGKRHNIDDIDCIWNTSMFKGHKIFKDKYGENAWEEYNNTINKYNFKLGITKYSHHIKNMNLKTRMNFQYLQCLDLWNEKYIQHFENLENDYDILDENNQGKIIDIAKYTTDLFEKIIKGDKFYTYKFMGITNTENYNTDSLYIKACLVNDIMLKDPAVKQFIYRKLKKSINEAKYGKIYVEGLYHTLVGDMIGYLQYSVGKDVIGCLNAGEFYSETLSKGDVLSFRSPLVCPSEVNKVKLVSNDLIKKWLSHFKDQDVVMTNMYDLSLPQQGGASQHKLAPIIEI